MPHYSVGPVSSKPSRRAVIERLETRTLLTGNFDFAAAVGAAGADAAKAMYTDRYGNIYVTGTFSGLVDFDPGAGVSTMNSVGGKDFFVAKYAADHSFLWARQVGGSGDEIAGGVFVDKPGNVYVTGGFTGTADFYPGKRVYNLTSSGYADVFVWKLDANGALLWAKQAGGTSSDWGLGITLDATGNVYVGGGFRGYLDFDPGPGQYVLKSYGARDAMVWELTNAGDFVMARSVGGSGEDFATAVAVDRYGNIWTTGYFTGSADFDPGRGVLSCTGAGGTDVFHLKLSSRAKLVCAWTMGGAGNDQANGMVLDRSGNVYTVGTFQGTADFNPSAKRTYSRASAGGTDGFLSILTATGGFVAGKALGGAGQDAANAVAQDAGGDLYLAGSFAQSADLSGAAQASFTATGGNDSFVAKFTSIGQFVYGRTTGGSLDDTANGVAIYGSQVFSAGSFSDTANLDPRGTSNVTSSGDADAYVLGLTQITPDLGAVAIVGATGSAAAKAVAAGPAGSTYIVGTFAGAVDFDPSHTNAALVLTSNGGDDAFVEKIDANGNIAWVKTFGGTGNETAPSVAVTPAGEVYITGQFQATVDFNTAADVYEVTATGTYDGYVLQLDADGDSVWVNTYGGTGASVRSNGITLDSEGFVYVAGAFTDTVNFNDAGAETLTSAGSSDIFVLNLAADGAFLWARQMGGTDADTAEAIAVDSDGDVYITGQYHGTADFDPGVGTHNLTATGTAAAFASRITTDGNFDYAVSLTGTDAATGSALVVDAAFNVFITGSFAGTLHFDPAGSDLDKTSAGNEDVFVLKLDVSGDSVWAYTAGGEGHDLGRSIDLDPSGNVLVAGSFTDTADFAGGPSLTSNGVEDIFIAKLNAGGGLLWSRGQGGTGSDMAFAIRAGGSSFVHAVGQFEDAVNFDFAGGTATLSTAGTTSFAETVVQ